MKIRIHPTLYGYLLSMLVLSSWQTCVGAMIALLVHETGHFCTGYLLHESIERIELTPFGGVMVYEQGKSPSKGIQGACVVAAGPAANYLLLRCVHWMASWITPELLYAIVSSNTVMLLINLLPAFPLDGGRMIFCFGYYLFPIAPLIRVLCCIGIAAGATFLSLAVYGMVVQGILNCSVVIVGGYLIYCAWRSREQVLLENLYTFLQETNEKKQQIQRVKFYCVPTELPIIRLVPLLGSGKACEFIARLNGEEQRISEKRLYSSLLEQPFATIQDAFFQKNNE